MDAIKLRMIILLMQIHCLKTNRLYIDLLDYPIKHLILTEFKAKAKYAQFLHDASEIEIGEIKGHWIEKELDENEINLILPVNKPNVEFPVIELFLN